jgi:hypothetical protein
MFGNDALNPQPKAFLPPTIKPQQQRHHRTSRQDEFYQGVRREGLKSHNGSRCMDAPNA